MSELTHFDEAGRARMVDVSAKAVTARSATAAGMVRLSPAAVAALRSESLPKGDALAVARIAGIQAAKRVDELIPLAHPLTVTFVDVRAQLDPDEGAVRLEAEARTVASTGVEMEALCACAVAALTVYDMVKGLERGVAIHEVVLLEKSGGRSGTWRRELSSAG